MASSSLNEDLSCSICLDTFSNPSTLPCGHSYCMRCIGNYWDQQCGKGTYNCPQCRQTFPKRPPLSKNTLLSSMLEKLSRVGLAETHPSAPPAPPEYSFQFPSFVIDHHETQRLLMIQQKQLQQQELRLALQTFNRSANAIERDRAELFSALSEWIQCCGEKVQNLIQNQREHQNMLAEEQLQKLEQEVHQLTHAQGTWQGCEMSAGSPVNSTISFSEVGSVMKKLQPKLEKDWSKMYNVLVHTVHQVCVFDPVQKSGTLQVSHGPQPGTREEHLKYWVELTIEPLSVHQELILSDGDRSLHRGQVQPYRNHPERFDCWGQALARQPLTGRCYWEVKWVGKQVDMGVAYGTMGRKGWGNDCGLGRNSQSWSIRCIGSKYVYCHDNQTTSVTVSAPHGGVGRIGVYLDHGAGLLAFYSVNDMQTPPTLTLLHSINTQFNQPLYFAVWIDTCSNVTLKVKRE
ncbi:E3 ubiquitin-protein ligase TRIM11 [Chanos chanos]|uniref:E3 ubiquitin-protein ligase TRIM11 n=1 Tax=Chanos chanos TaxID=29144 RepID=A0A6J2V4X6_CHACN|nr:E3 ubiquitin-protein ligase TRIM11-like [Chanos chanos]